MSGKWQTRQQQHRPTNENQRSRELGDLKRQNHRLEVQNARLRKQLSRATEVKEGFEGYEGEPDDIETKNQPTGTCPQPGCSGILKTLDLGPKTFEICPACKFRRLVA